MLTRYDSNGHPARPTEETIWAQETLNKMEFCTIREAAKILGRHHKTIYLFIRTNPDTVAFRMTDAGCIVYLPSLFAAYGKVFIRE